MADKTTRNKTEFLSRDNEPQYVLRTSNRPNFIQNSILYQHTTRQQMFGLIFVCRRSTLFRVGPPSVYKSQMLHNAADNVELLI